MNKPYLLIVNEQYYSDNGTGDWVRCYEYESDAIAEGVRLCGDDYFYSYKVVDLRVWMK